MLKRIILGVLILGTVAASGYYVATRYLVSDEDKVRSTVHSLISNLERENRFVALLGIERRLSGDYRHIGEGRTIDKPLALRFLSGLKQRYTDFCVEVREMTVTVDGDTAEVVITGRVTAAPEGDSERRTEVMTDPGRNRAVIQLAREDAEWKVVQSERVQFRLDDDN
jgi:hypothetical protein